MFSLRNKEITIELSAIPSLFWSPDPKEQSGLDLHCLF